MYIRLCVGHIAAINKRFKEFFFIRLLESSIDHKPTCQYHKYCKTFDTLIIFFLYKKVKWWLVSYMNCQMTYVADDDILIHNEITFFTQKNCV